MPGAEPIFIEAGPTALLFVHGFTGSPYEGRPFADYFSRRGFTVSVPLLPGHGTRPGDMLGVSWQDWYRATVQAWQQLRERFQQVVVCGQSMGGALALNLAAHHAVEAFIGLAAATYLTDWRLRLLPLARHLWRYQYKSRGPDIRDPAARKQSVHYRKYPLNSIVELLALLRHVRGDLMDVTAPALLFHSIQDHVVPYGNLKFIADNLGSQVVETVTLQQSYHVISVDLEREQVFGRIEAFLKEQKLVA
ncbi:MAG: alpha/beta fold hydrolase [Calditrichaeota bacterium]|nr:MAG: alpha/beta fold hydrolase [Calditrichota bacterium]